MPFDVYALDDHDWFSGAEKELNDYQDALLEALADSPEGQAQVAAYGDAGFWTANFVYFGFVYNGVSLPQMTVDDVAEVVEELFPEKVSILQAEDTKGAVAELIALWTYLKRAHGLPQADAILAYLRDIEPDFPSWMMDSSKFGMAKSFVMMGQEAGFDMTDEKETNAFIAAYNAAALLADEQRQHDTPESSSARAAKAKRRQKRKAEKAARKKQRGKR